MRTILALAAFLVSATWTAGAQPSPAQADPATARRPAAVARAVRAEGPLQVDGRLDEAAWTRAPWAEGFVQREPAEGQPASEPTAVRIVYDDAALYVGARLGDRGPVRGRLGRRDMELAGSDWLRVSLDSYRDRRTAFRFDVNPAGVRRDAHLGGDGELDSWDAVWDAAVAVDSAGWTVEMRIPFSQLRFSPADEQTWGIQLERVVDRLQETAVFAFTPKSEAGGVAAFGELAGLRGIRGGRRLELLPYAVARGELADPGPNPFRTAREYGAQAGLDARLRVTSDLALTATVNPDFGQVEVDPAVINLSAFETFYDEKRPFFVEGAGSFDFGGAPPGPWPSASLFYSRRIGRQPQLGAPTRAADVPEATRILGAAKLTGRTAGGWSVGVLDAVTRAEYSRYRTEDGTDGRASAEPAANYFAGRVSRELREGRTAFGAIATAVHRDLDGDDARAALRSGAYAGGADFRYESDDRGWAVSGFAAGSRIEGSPEALARAQRSPARYLDRPDARRLDFDPAATSLSGYAGQLRLRKQAGEHLRADVAASVVSPGFEVNDLGFQSRADWMGANAILRWQENRPGPLLRSWSLQGMANLGRNFDGDWIDQWSNLSLTLQGLGYWGLVVAGGWEPGRPDDRLTRGGPLAAAPARWNAGFLATSDPRRALSGRLRGRVERDAAGGRETQLEVGAQLRPSPRWGLSVGPQLVRAAVPAQYLARVEDPTAGATFGARYLFAPLRYAELSLQTRLDVSFTPDLTLELYAQPLLSSGAFAAPRELERPGSFRFRAYPGAERVETPDGAEYRIDPDGAAGPAAEFRVPDADFASHALRGNAVLRWEWRPGSTFYAVWQQGRAYEGVDGALRPGAVESLLRARADDVFVLKWTWWLNPGL